MNISIKTIPHKSHRYETVGDYWKTKDGFEVRISKMKKWEYEALVTIHELVELFLVKQKGISIKEIDEFDKEMEKSLELFSVYSHTIKDSGYYVERIKCRGINCLKGRGKENSDEPGICARAPYYKEHMFAMKLEKLLCKEFGIKWKDYDNYVCNL